MFSHFFIFFLFVKFDFAQENGDFWWLNDKFSNYLGTRPPNPRFEKLSALDNDENAKIIFRDHSFIKENLNTIKNTNSQKHNNLNLHEVVSDRNMIRWPNEKINNSSYVPEHLTEDQIHAAPTASQFVFQFPANDNVQVYKNIINSSAQSSLIPTTENKHLNTNILTTTPTNNSTVFYSDKVSFALYYKDKLSENICTYMKKTDCYQKKGALNIDMKDEKKNTLNTQLICCILPMKTRNENILQKITFPDVMKHVKRLKRSKNSAHAQRNILLFHNYANKKHKTKQATPTSVDDYEYEDPYVNIKNHKNQNNHKQGLMVKQDHVDDYRDDYVVEIPAPGLTGLYSDINEDKDTPYSVPLEYEDDDRTDFGYSTIDPRIGKNKKRKSKLHYKPSKLTTTSDEIYDLESQTISYESDPNFNVLQDFKLPNLTRKKVLKATRSTTTESFSSGDIEDLSKDEELDKGFLNNKNECEHRQIFKGCGKTFNPIVMQNDKQIGDTENGSHPWLAILVPTHKENKLLCYASLIHPRAAVTAGDCVYRNAPGEITLIAALWNLSDRSRSGKRVVIAILHTKYQNGELSNNLALLHWKKPLKLGVNVQPICLANPQSDHECMFIGWGGFDQAIRTQSRWQRATVHNCKEHTSLIGISLPNEAFCASVKSRSTVTGIGGSLVCKVEGHLSAVGIAVSRDSTLILLPIYDWVTSPGIGNVVDYPDD